MEQSRADKQGRAVSRAGQGMEQSLEGSKHGRAKQTTRQATTRKNTNRAQIVRETDEDRSHKSLASETWVF